MNSSKYCLITTTFENKEEANKISEILLKKRLVSCSQISSITSSYHWKGKIEHEEEFLLQMKSKTSLYKEIESEILKYHSYEAPQIIMYEIKDGYSEYLKWIDDETKENNEKCIVLASNNNNKLKEFREILNNKKVLSLKDIGFNEEIEETGKTFLENSLIKAKTVSNYLKERNLEYIVIADDSGLCVNALNGEPGVYSARYSGDHSNSQLNRKKLLDALENKEDRSAYFVCNIVMYYPDDTYLSFEGKTFGKITKEELGSKEFGYDCIFYSDDLEKTFGEATAGEKNKVSHRGRAVEKLLEKLN